MKRLLSPDLRKFDARRFRGVVGILSAGFPCQPHSVAGKREGTEDERWLWPDIDRIIDECRPELVFLENVAGLLRDAGSDVDTNEDLGEQPDDAIGGMGTVLRDLAERGYDAQWLRLRASRVGASHQRARVFILAYARQPRLGWAQESTVFGGPWRSNDNSGTGGTLADPSSRQLPQQGRGSSGRNGPGSTGADLELGNPGREHEPRQQGAAYEQRSEGGRRSSDGSNDVAIPTEQGLQKWEDQPGNGGEAPGNAATTRTGGNLEYSSLTDAIGGIFAPGPADSRWNEVLVLNRWLRPSVSQAEVESPFCNLADGLADLVDVNRTDALRMLGNGVVPLQAAAAFTELLRRIEL